MKLSFLLTIILLLCYTALSADNAMVIFREVVAKGDTTQTLKLVLREIPDYPVSLVKTPKETQLLMQSYKDGGDGIISPLDSLSNPTGDDIMITHPSHLQPSQGIYFQLSCVWSTNCVCFYPPLQGNNEDAWQGDKIYLRIFNNTTLDTSSKYIVSHTLYTAPAANTIIAYVPDYAWDAKGWISFR